MLAAPLLGACCAAARRGGDTSGGGTGGGGGAGAAGRSPTAASASIALSVAGTALRVLSIVPTADDAAALAAAARGAPGDADVALARAVDRAALEALHEVRERWSVA